MENMFFDRLRAGEDGEYRWVYDTEHYHNYDYCLRWVKRIALITVPIGVVALVGGRNARPYGVVLFTGLCMILMPALLALFWRFFPPEPSYRMSEKELVIGPNVRRDSRKIFEFKDLRRVACFPEKDLLVLHFGIARVRVYVPKEDFELAQELLRARAPQGTEFLR